MTQELDVKKIITSFFIYTMIFLSQFAVASMGSSPQGSPSIFRVICPEGAVPRSDSPIPLKSRTIGEGTHGKVSFYETSPELCSKVVMSSSNALHEMQMHTHAQQIINPLKDPYITVPKVVKFKEDKFKHHIIMDRILPLLPGQDKLIHLTWNYPLDWKSEDSQGFYLGINQFIDTFKDKVPVDVVAQNLGKFYGLLHNKGFDAFDMEFVIGVSKDDLSDWKIYGYDFDKCNLIDPNSPEDICIERKISEDMKDHVKGRIKIFARAIAYYPVRQDLFEQFKLSYMRSRADQGDDAASVMNELEKFISFE